MVTFVWLPEFHGTVQLSRYSARSVFHRFSSPQKSIHTTVRAAPHDERHAAQRRIYAP